MSTTADTSHRWDIQALRGLAVAGVLLQHAAPGLLRGGYLGVDLFFVISGFLITGQVLAGLRAGRFSLAGFYARRARRLLPAAYVVLALTMLASPWALAPLERADLAHQHWGALGFASNFVLWAQSGYFDVAAELKPLLHFWSLSLEEQYYLLLPALLMGVGTGRRGLGVLVGLTLASLLLGLALQRVDASAAFYLLPSRAWELGIGSLAAWAHASGWRAPAATRWPATVLLLSLLLMPLPAWGGFGHPGANALLVTLATATLLLSRGRAQAPRVLAPVVRLGDISYALYLVHWPLIAFVNNAWVGPPDAPGLAQARWIAAAVSLPLGWLLWRGVEQPTRRWPLPRTWRGWGAVLGATALLAVLPLLLPSPQGDTDARRPNHGFSVSCDQWERWVDRPECRNAAQPRWAVWGDSYAMHLVPGLAPLAPGLVQMTESSCGPLPGLVPWRPDAPAGASFTRDWARQCERFNRSVIQALRAPGAPGVVIVSSLLEQYLGPPGGQLLRIDGALEREVAPAQAEDELVAAAARLAEALRAQGRRLVWVSAPPKGGFDAGACVERRQLGQFTLGAPVDCGITLADAPPLAKRATALLQRFEREAGVPVLWLHASLCSGGVCRTADADGLAFYRDAGHLSVAGSRRLLPQVATRQSIEALAGLNR
ncbi:acyltransferase family protein [Roseateles sp. DC23W]|uniref:Acyltransferase family protein n=1 Tax=Pelomonas dachongensis TaxID=3299029 RepID=A0ABW7EM89_9BURK